MVVVKPAMAAARRPGDRAELAASWLPPQKLRCLATYKVPVAYDNNQAGQLSAAAGDEAALERRELGDAAKLVDTALDYRLGSDQQIAVEGADHADDEVPPPGTGDAAGAQRRLRQWADKELLSLKVQQAERSVVLLGGSVYVLARDPDKGRPRLRTYDPDSTSRSGTRTRTRTFPVERTWRGSCRRIRSWG